VGRALAGIQLIEAPAILKSGSPGEPRLIARWLDRAASDNRFEGAQEPHYLAQAGVFVSSQQSCATGDRRYRRPARCRRLLCVWATRGAGAGPALPLPGDRGSEFEAGGGRHLRRRPGRDRCDHLGGADPGQVGARGRHIAVPELSLQDRQRHAFTGELNGVRVAELMWREPAPDASVGREPSELCAHGGARPGAEARGSVRRSRRTTVRPAAACVRLAMAAARPTPTCPPRPRDGARLCRAARAPSSGSGQPRSVSVSESASWIRSAARHSTTISARARSP
jgi:hypothetical protein